MAFIKVVDMNNKTHSFVDSVKIPLLILGVIFLVWFHFHYDITLNDLLEVYSEHMRESHCRGCL